jgi:RNase H-fold protein (predicted Holliday junction resolvase)
MIKYNEVATSIGNNCKALCTVTNNGNLTAISQQLIALAKRNGVSEIIVGLPLDSVSMQYYLCNTCIYRFERMSIESIKSLLSSVAQITNICSYYKYPYLTSYIYWSLLCQFCKQNGKMSTSVRNFNGRLCLNFSSVLSAVLKNEYANAEVMLVDERYTTREAKARIQQVALEEV